MLVKSMSKAREVMENLDLTGWAVCCLGVYMFFSRSLAWLHIIYMHVYICVYKI